MPGALESIPFAERTIPTVIAQLAVRWTDKVALSFVDSGAKLTYASLEHEIARSADVIAGAGGGAGAVTVILLENCPELFLIWWGTAWVGGLTCMLNPELPDDQLRTCLETVAPAIVVIDQRKLDSMTPIMQDLQYSPAVLVVGSGAGYLREPKAMSWQQALSVAVRRPAVAQEPGDPFTLMFTSGSTGTSKCVLQSHHYALVFADTAVVSQRLESADRSYECRPCFHVAAAYSVVLASLLVGAEVCVAPRFSATAFWHEVAETGASRLALIGAMANILYRRPPDEWERRHCLKFLRAVPLPADPQAFEERFGVRLLLPGWGSTEVWPLAPSFDERAGELPDNYVGRVAADMQVRIADANGFPVEPDGRQLGEILVRTDHPLSMMTCYYGDPAATVTAWRDLWYHTGDLGTIDTDDRVYWRGRTADVIRRRGENISCALIESVALQAAGIAECAAYGVPSSLGEEDVKLDVVLAPGTHATRMSELSDHLERQLPAFMVPRFIEIREDLPKTASHRVIKALLRDQPLSASVFDREDRGR